MSKDDYIKLPRLYVDQDLKNNAVITLGAVQAHYLRNVMRRKEGDGLRLFNGRHGEWQAMLEAVEKKMVTARLIEQKKPQPAQSREIHLLFAPIKKARLDIMIEKSVELGATHLHPVLTEHTEVRKLNDERLSQQIVEAAEQCERLDIPQLLPMLPLKTAISAWAYDVPLYACIERRADIAALDDCDLAASCAFLIGPEGGFSQDETAYLATEQKLEPVRLGERIYRAETAALLCLAKAAR